MCKQCESALDPWFSALDHKHSVMEFRIVKAVSFGLDSVVRVQHKLFIATLCASTVLVIIMLSLAQWSFDSGLLRQVNERAAQQYEGVIDDLRAHYRTYGHWQTMRNQPEHWDRIISKLGLNVPGQGIGMGLAPKAGSQEHPPQHRTPAPSDGFAHGDRRSHPFPPPHLQRQGPDGNRPNQPNMIGGRFPPHMPPQPGVHQNRAQPQTAQNQKQTTAANLPRPQSEPFALTDTQKRPIVGRLAKEEHRRYMPIEVDGAVVGYLLYANRERMMDDFDLDFSNEIRQNLWWIAALMIVLSAALAMPFAILLLKPLRPIVETIHQLAKGNLNARVNINSQDEIGKVAEDVNNMAQSLSENEQHRKTWLANISHELRTPVAIMRGEFEAMLDGVRDINRENVQSAHQEILQLQRLVDDLYQLTSSDIGALSYHQAPLELVGVIEDMVERLEHTVNKAGLTITLNTQAIEDDEVWIQGDEQRIAQLIHNLITNSVKYTRAPGHIAVALNQDAKNTYIIIQDSAPGVNDKDLLHLFDHLYRTEQSRNRKTGGSGLGLAICKSIVDNHNGHIEAQHSPAGGITMTIRFPKLDV